MDCPVCCWYQAAVNAYAIAKRMAAVDSSLIDWGKHLKEHGYNMVQRP
jgi:hypothetical protein